MKTKSIFSIFQRKFVIFSYCQPSHLLNELAKLIEELWTKMHCEIVNLWRSSSRCTHLQDPSWPKCLQLLRHFLVTTNKHSRINSIRHWLQAKQFNPRSIRYTDRTNKKIIYNKAAVKWAKNQKSEKRPEWETKIAQNAKARFMQIGSKH